MESKKCFKCGEQKPRTDFYKHPQMADGFLNKCKECNKRDVRENRLARIDHYREYDANRYKLDPNVKARHLEYIKTDTGRLSMARSRQKWINENPEARRAHIIVGNAVRDGRLTKQPCTVCGTVKNLHAHHEDYSLPLDVTWFCAEHHSAHHREK